MPEVRVGDETFFFKDFPSHEDHVPKLSHGPSDKFFIGFFTLVFVVMIGACFLNCCIYFFKRHRQRMEGGEFCNSPVVVTSATHTAPGGYPVTQIPATTYQPNAYGTPYPAQTTGNVSMQMPMPMPGAQPPMPGMQPHMVAYPPMPQPGAGVANMNPPTYDMAMANAGPSVMPGGYEKQMPYNPNYAQQ